MTEPEHNNPPEQVLPSDDEIAAMIRKAEGGDEKKRRKDTEPGPRMPEALWYSLFILAESLVLLGVWAFMSRGPAEVLKGPSIDAPVMDQLRHHLVSIWSGLVQGVTGYPLLVAMFLACAAVVWVPATPRARKRLATIVSTLIVVGFVALIALQFSQDMTSLSTLAP